MTRPDNYPILESSLGYHVSDDRQAVTYAPRDSLEAFTGGKRCAVEAGKAADRSRVQAAGIRQRVSTGKHRTECE